MRKIVHSYPDLTGGQWLRGNLHTHTTRSDGAQDPQTVLDEYARRKYDFLSISDHDIFTSEAEYAEWDSRGMVMIPGNEVSRGGPHILHVGGDRFIEPTPSRQTVLSAISAAPRGWSIVNHPNWGGSFNHCSYEQLREWTGYVGMEIYNGVICRLPGTPYALDKWDRILDAGGRPWGFANDDSHAAQDIALGWNVVYSRERTPAAIVDAMRRGCFYASTGVTIRSIQVDGMKIRIETEDAERIVAHENLGKRFAVADERSIEVTVPKNASYVRFECWGRGERFAWTQPFFIESETDDAATAAGKSLAGRIDEWRVSPLQSGLSLEKASPEHAKAQPSTPLQMNPANHRGMPNFLDLRGPIDGRGGVVYASAEIKSDKADPRAVLRLGYDGPLRVWLNDQPIFDGPGTNPAVKDKLALYAPLRAGANQLLIAFDSNGGRAWGLYCRRDMEGS